MATSRTHDVAHAIQGGVIAGLAAGLALSIFMAVMNALGGVDLWMGMKAAGAPFMGSRATTPGFDGLAVVVGLLSHFGVSIVWGVLFGLVFYGLSAAATVTAGGAWGLIVWLGMFYVVLPLAGLEQMAASVPVRFAILEHVLFGLALGVAFMPFQPRPAAGLRPRIAARRFERRPTGTA